MSNHEKNQGQLNPNAIIYQVNGAWYQIHPDQEEKYHQFMAALSDPIHSSYIDAALGPDVITFPPLLPGELEDDEPLPHAG